MQRVSIVLAIVYIVCQASLAAPLVFRDHNFSIEFPPDWRRLDPPPGRTVAGAQTSDGLKRFVVVVRTLPGQELPTASRHLIAGAKQSAIDNGWQVTNEYETSLGGVPFHAFRSQVSATESMVTYASVAGGKVYMLTGFCKASDAGSDPEVHAAAKSFRLLSPVSLPTERRRPKTLAYRTGYIFGQVFVLALVGAGVFWGIRGALNKRKKA